MKVESLHISNFRLFKQLDIKGLKRINLIVGKNNSGKSALLEAIQIYLTNANPLILFDLIRFRQEYWDAQTSPEIEVDNASALKHLFYGHKLPDADENGFIIGPLEQEETQLHITIAALLNERIDDKIVMRIVSIDDLDDTVSDYELVLIDKNKQNIIVKLNEDFKKIHLRYQTNENSTSVQLVPVQVSDNLKIASLWDGIALTVSETEVITGLQLLEPNINGLTFVETKRPFRYDRRIPIVKCSGIDEPLPLKSMGDGINRLLHIILALVNAKDGVLLIDEFENGLHWSVQPKVWEIVFNLAEKLNVQVFATTHSRDCVASFGNVWKSNEEDGAFFRINNIDEKTYVTPYTSETLSDALDTDVETR